MRAFDIRQAVKRISSPTLFHLGVQVGRLPPRDGCVIVTFHRVIEAERIGPLDRTIWSGSPDAFERTLRGLQAHFTLISFDELLASLSGAGRLPPRAMLVTFDDGYRDVFLNAFPRLQRAGCPAAIFVTTDLIDQHDELLWTDALSYAFCTTRQDAMELPGRNALHLNGEASRRAACVATVGWLKLVPNDARRRLVDQLLRSLKVTLPRGIASGLYLSSEELLTMSRHGMTIGSHSCSHPILSRLDEAACRRELAESKCRLEAILGTPVRYFAYPNGLPEDYSDRTVGLLREVGFQLAVTTTPGTNRLNGRCDPFRLRRCHGGRNWFDVQDALGRACFQPSSSWLAHRTSRSRAEAARFALLPDPMPEASGEGG